MEGDTKGTYLASLFSGRKTVEIITTPWDWISDFYLPEADTLAGMNQQKYVIKFDSEVENTSTIHYSGNIKILQYGYTLLFENTKGVWCLARKLIYVRYILV